MALSKKTKRKLVDLLTAGTKAALKSKGKKKAAPTGQNENIAGCGACNPGGK